MLKRNKYFKITKSELNYQESKGFIDYVLNSVLNNKTNTYEAFASEIALKYAFLAYYTDYTFTTNVMDYSVAVSFSYYDFEKKVNINQLMMLIDAVDKQIYFELSQGDYVDHLTLNKADSKEEDTNE